MTNERGKAESDSDVNYEDDPEPITDADLLDPGGGPWEELSEMEQEAEAIAEEARYQAAMKDQEG